MKSLLLPLLLVTLTACTAQPQTLLLDTTTQERKLTTTAPATTAHTTPSATQTPDGCTIIKTTVHSPSMKRDIETVILLPPTYDTQKEARFPVLYALPGMDAPYASFTDMAPLRAALKTQPMIVVSFNVDKRGWYIDATKKPDSLFTTFFFDELIPHIDKTYRTKGDGQSRGVTGFSMGGYGAFHYMLSHPEKFASASSLSGAFAFASDQTHARRRDSVAPLLGAYEENKDAYTRNAICPRLDTHISNNTPLPPMYIHCGTEDGIIKEGRDLNAYLIAQNKKLTEQKKPALTFSYKESAGEHKWPFWRDAMPDVIHFHYTTFQKPAATQPATTKP
jgi:S-formylglutathione hydrolase FrmB